MYEDLILDELIRLENDIDTHGTETGEVSWCGNTETVSERILWIVRTYRPERVRDLRIGERIHRGEGV